MWEKFSQKTQLFWFFNYRDNGTTTKHAFDTKNKTTSLIVVINLLNLFKLDGNQSSCSWDKGQYWWDNWHWRSLYPQNWTPSLHYQDQTPSKPIKLQDKKRGLVSWAQLSTKKKIEKAVQKSIANLISTILSTTQKPCKLISERWIMNLFFEAKKDEVRGKVMDYLGFQGRRCDHKTLSDTEMLETYNRWDNIGITGIKKKQNWQEFAECKMKTCCQDCKIFPLPSVYH